MISENILRVKLEATSDGQFKATMGDAAQGVSNLDEAQRSVVDSTNAATAASRENASATAALGESNDEAAARIKAMVRASLERQQAELSSIAATQRSTATNAGAAAGYERVVAAQTRAMHGATDLVRAEQQAAAAAANTAGLEKQRAELGRLLGQIDPTIAALEKLDAQQAKLDAFRAKGVLGADDYKMFSAAIDQSRERIAAAGNAMHGFSVNNANARRELGYITKDLATGQFGRLSQSILTLGANTGVMGLAFSAAGLLIGGAVAVLGSFAVAAAKGYFETEQLRVSLIATGGAAGATVGQVNDMAEAVGAATGKYSDARKAIEQLVGSGKSFGTSLDVLAQQAVDMSTVTGESIDKSVAKIIEIGDKPSEAIAKLNEQYHFLTAAQYAQIAALEAEGHTREAARIANQLDAAAMKERAQDVQDNAGWMIRAGHAVAEAWNGAWDSMKGLGRTQSITDQIKEVQAAIDKLTTPHLDRAGNLVQAQGGEQLAALRKQLAALQLQGITDQFASQQTSNDAALNAEAIAAQRRLSAGTPADVVLKNTLDKLRMDRASALYGVVDPQQRALIEAQFDNQVKAANNTYQASLKKLAGPQGPKSKEPAAYNTFSSQVDALDRKSIQADTSALTQYQQGIAQLAAQMETYLQKGGDATKAAELFNRGQQALQRTLDDNRKRELAGQKEYADALDRTNAALQDSVDNQVARIGMGAQEYQRTQQITKAYRDEAEQLQKLALQRQAGAAGQQGGLSQEAYDADVKALQDATDRKVEIIRDGFRRMDDAQGDWINGARAAWQDYAAQAKDKAGQAQRGITTLYSDAEDAAADWLAGGKLTFKSFEKDFENMLAHMVAKALIAQATTALLDLFAPGAGAAASGGYGYFGGGYNSVTREGGFNLATAGTRGHADGGPIRGPGTGTSDSVLIRASNGEYMQTADAVNYYGERFMDDVRAKRLPRYAAGGPIGGSSGGAAGGTDAGGVVVNIYGADNGARTEQRDGADGRKYLDIFINAAAQDVARGGRLGQAIHAATGTRRPARSYAAAGG
mgnify:CR=1 FL=1